MNKHREIIYSKRNKILNSENIDADVKNMINSQIKKII
jgi:preprotein translocase subunit SecA